MIKKILISVVLLSIGNEAISLAVLCVWAFVGAVRLLKAAAKGGAFDA